MPQGPQETLGLWAAGLEGLILVCGGGVCKGFLAERLMGKLTRVLKVGGVDRLFQAKFLDRTEQGYMLELGFKKISQSAKVVFIYQVTIAWNLKLSLS